MSRTRIAASLAGISSTLLPAPTPPQPRIVTPQTRSGVTAEPSPPGLRVIDVASLPEALQKEMRERLAKYEGSPLSRDVMQQIARSVDEVDKHVHVAMLRT